MAARSQCKPMFTPLHECFTKWSQEGKHRLMPMTSNPARYAALHRYENPKVFRPHVGLNYVWR